MSAVFFQLCPKMGVMSAGRIGSTSPPFCPQWRRTSPHTERSPPTHSNGLHRHQKRPPIQAIRCTHQIPIRKTESHTHTWERLWMGGGCLNFLPHPKSWVNTVWLIQLVQNLRSTIQSVLINVGESPMVMTHTIMGQ